MKIALINEDSQADKNSMIYDILQAVAQKKGHQVDNYGMLSLDAEEINFTQIGLLASILIETKAADFVVTGCGTGQGAMISCNAFQNLVCGYVASPLDAYLFSQVNAGNVISMPFAQSFGWGAEVNLRNVFETLFAQEFGLGYPAIHAQGEKRSRIRMINEIKLPAQYSPIDAYRRMEVSIFHTLLNYEPLKTLLLKHAQESETLSYLKTFME